VSLGDLLFFFSRRRRHTRFKCDWSSDVCSSDLEQPDLTRALIELRLEAARHPDLALALGSTLRRGYRDDVAFQLGSGLPGGAFEIGRASCRERGGAV